MTRDSWGTARVDVSPRSRHDGSICIVLLLALVGVSACDRGGGTPALEQGDPLHAEGIQMPPEELGLPPRIAPRVKTELVVAPPPFSEGIFPCSRCHVGGEPVVDTAPAMPHAPHIENDMECSDCHFPGDATEPRMPSVKVCFLCHDQSDEDDAARSYFVAIRTEAGDYAFPQRWQTRDVIVNHAAHEAAGIECAECHGATAEEPFAKPKPIVLMQRCLDCHEARERESECSECHTEALEPFHENIELDHGRNIVACFQCHNPDDRDTLRLASGEALPFAKSYELCGQCHGPKLRDWEQGLHGKRVGYWDAERRYLLCVHCHQNPHQPSFPAMRPMPPPLRPEDIR